MLRGVLLVLVVSAAACRCESPPHRVEDHAICTVERAAQACWRDPSAFDCSWLELINASDPEAALTTVIGSGELGANSAIRTLFSIGTREMVADTPRTEKVTVQMRDFEPQVIEVPIDWAKDPYGNNTWRQRFQGLSWVDALHDDETIDFAAASTAIVQWADGGLLVDPPLEWAWRGMTGRLDVVIRFVEAYIAQSPVLHRDVLVAAAKIIVSHVYALGARFCYERGHNHGAMQDAALLRAVTKFPALSRTVELRHQAETRLVREQAGLAITSDGVHTENSPHYHIFYANLLSQILDAYRDSRSTPPAELLEVRDRMLAPLVHLFQPNRTFPQFGDSLNRDRKRELAHLLEHADSAELRFILTDGKEGRAPAETDVVFDRGGYASFRNSWTYDTPGTDIAGHFSCARHSKVHYHRDETSIEIYGFRSELIVDAGLHTYDSSDPFTQHQYSTHAHNVLIVDDVSYAPTGQSGIIGHHVGESSSYVQGGHTHYAKQGVPRVIRTFAQVSSDTFWIVDSAQSDGAAHRYSQRFHLHPELVVARRSERAIVARARDGTGPAVTLIAGHDVGRVSEVRGWYFQAWGKPVATTAIDFNVDSSASRVDLSIWIHIGEGEASDVEEPELEVVANQLVGRWESPTGALSIAVPRP